MIAATDDDTFLAFNTFCSIRRSGDREVAAVDADSVGGFQSFGRRVVAVVHAARTARGADCQRRTCQAGGVTHGDVVVGLDTLATLSCHDQPMGAAQQIDVAIGRKGLAASGAAVDGDLSVCDVDVLSCTQSHDIRGVGRTGLQDETA